MLINSAAGRVKDRHILADPRVNVSIHDQRDGYRYMSVRGVVEERLTGDEAERGIDVLNRKYHDDEPWAYKEGQVRVLYRDPPRAVSSATTTTDGRGTPSPRGCDLAPSRSSSARPISSAPAGRSRPSSRGAPSLDHPVGPGRHGQDDAREPPRRRVGADLLQLSAVSSGVADARKSIEAARGGLFRTVLFVDEVHRGRRPSRTSPPRGRGRNRDVDRGDHREPVLLADLAAALACLLLRLEPLDGRGPRDAACGARSPTRAGPRARSASGSTDEALDHLVEIAGGDARIGAHGSRGRGARPRAAGRGHVTLDAAPTPSSSKADRLRPAGRRALRRHQRVHQVASAAPIRTRRCSGSPG